MPFSKGKCEVENRVVEGDMDESRNDEEVNRWASESVTVMAMR